MKWVLLWFIWREFNGMGTAGSESFETKENCERAGIALYEIAKKETNSVLFKCVKK